MQKISEQASLRVREKKYHHRLSRRGYANTEMDLVSVLKTCICIMTCIYIIYPHLTVNFMY